MFTFLAFWLRRQPIESIVLLGIPSIVALGILLAQPSGGLHALTGALGFATMQFFFGGAFLAIFFAVVYIYLAYRIAIGLIHVFRLSPGVERTQHIHYAVRVTGSGLYILLVLGGASLLSHLLIGPLATTSPQKVIAASDLLMQWDKQVFGVYTPFWLMQFGTGVVDAVLVWSYKILSVLTSFLLLALLATRTALFRLFILAFFIASFLGVPLWYAFPAVSPEEMYYQNLLDRSLPVEIQQVLPAQRNISPVLAAYLYGIAGRWSDAKAGTFAVTTFPSMHAAWGLIVAYAAMLLWRPLGLFFIPWTVANLISTVYTLQHYAVDTLAGMGIAVLAIMLARVSLRIGQKKQFFTASGFFAFADMVQGDVRAAIRGIRSLV